MKKPERMMHRRRKGWGIVLVLILLGGLAAAYTLLEPLLLEHATRIQDMRATDLSEGLNYAWLSDHELLCFRPEGNLWQYDTRTRTETILPALTKQIKSSIPFPTAHWLVPSPDGKWVLWGQSSNNPLFVASIDGARRLEWPVDYGSNTVSEPYWMADSQRWMEWFYQSAGWKQIKVHSLADPHPSRTISSLPPGLKGLDILSIQSEERIIAKTRDVEIMGKPMPSGAGYIAITSVITYRDTQELSVWSLHAPKPLHQYTIHLPGLVRTVKVSPPGDSVAWLVYRQNTSPVFKMLQRLFPTLKKDEYESQVIGEVNMQAFLRRLLCVFCVLAVLVLPTFALAQRQSHTPLSPCKAAEQAIDDFIYVLQPMSLGCELPGVHLQLITKGVPGSPMEAWEHISLKVGKQTLILQNLNALHGHVSISDGPTALRYVRLLTSSETWFLWKQQRAEAEILEAGDALTVPNFGLSRQSRFLSSPSTTAGIKGGFQMTSWRYDRQTHKMELTQSSYQNGKDKETILKTMNPPDFTLLGDGSMGILPRKAYRAGGFSPATVVPVSGGFQITRWLYVEEDHNNERTVSVQQVQEFVGTDGTYRRTILKTKTPPSLPDARLWIPRFA